VNALVAVRSVFDEERAGGRVPDAAGGPFIADPGGDAALRLALMLAAGPVAVSVAPPARAEPALRRALASGAAEALALWDESLADADVAVVAAALAALARSRAANLVVCGARSADAGTGALPGYLAGLLGWTCVDAVLDGRLVGGEVRLTRAIRGGREVVATAPPLVIAMAEDAAPAPYPPVAARLKAARAALRLVSPREAGLDDPATLRPKARVDRITLPKPTCPVSMRAAHPSPELRAAMALAGAAAFRTGPRTGHEGIEAALEALEQAGVLRKGETAD
jgi:electron transfer flavoprotein beta subunit